MQGDDKDRCDVQAAHKADVRRHCAAQQASLSSPHHDDAMSNNIKRDLVHANNKVFLSF